MVRNYRNIGKQNNLIAMGSGLSQGTSDNNFIASVKIPVMAIESLANLVKAYTVIQIGGWEDVLLY